MIREPTISPKRNISNSDSPHHLIPKTSFLQSALYSVLKYQNQSPKKLSTIILANNDREKQLPKS